MKKAMEEEGLKVEDKEVTAADTTEPHAATASTEEASAPTEGNEPQESAQADAGETTINPDDREAAIA